MVIVTWLCGYGFISVLLSLIPSAIARARGKNFYYWWAGSSLGLLITVSVIQNNLCVVPIVVLIVLCIAALVRLPINSNEAIKN
jgi:hypothetical protein